MPIKLALRVSIYLLVLDGVAALVMGGLLSLPGSALVLLAVAGSWWGKQGRGLSTRFPLLWRALPLAGATFVSVDFFYLADSLLDGFVHLLLLLICYKLCYHQSPRDSRDVIILSFFMLVAAGAFTVDITFLLVVAVFLVLGILALMLNHVVTEIRGYRQEQPALLSAGWFVTPAFVRVVIAASALTLAFTIAFFFVIPRIGQAALPLKAKGGLMATGFSDRVTLGAFGSIQTDPTVVMRVRFPDGSPPPGVLARLRWRGRAFDHFTGQEWQVSRRARKLLSPRPIGDFFLAAPLGGQIVTQEIFLEPIGTGVIFAAPRLLSLTLPEGVVTVDSMGSVAFSLTEVRLRYLASSELEGVLRRSPKAEPQPLPDESLTRYLQLPPLSPRIPALARAVTRESQEPYEAALALTQYLRRTLRYSLDLRGGTGLAPLEEFLFVTREGNCEYFASSLVVFLRSLGIPARVVTGFQRGEWNPYGEYLVVRQRDAHAWVEAYFAGQGWVTLDPSPRAQFEAGFLTSELSHYLDALQMQWYRYGINWSLTEQLAVASALRQHALGWSRAVPRVGGSIEWASWGRWLLGVGAGGGALLLLVGLRRGFGRIGPRRPSPSRRHLRAYERMLKHLARQGLVPQPAETAREFASRANLALPDSGAVFREITEVYERIRFGGGEVGPGEEGWLCRRVRELRVATVSGRRGLQV